MSDEKPYKLEADDDDYCAKCHRGRSWLIVGPDDNCGTCQSWDDEVEAQYICDLMNRAYAEGQKAAKQ